MNKIDPEFKKKWIAALLSGNYKQTIGCLRNLDGFCCLGVACDIIDKTQWDFRDEIGRYYYKQSFCIPPYDTRNLIGLKDKSINQLVDMNENGWTFLQIARWIESDL